MAKTVSELLQRVKKVLEDSQQNVVGNFRALSNPETRADWARPISSAASNLVKQVVPPSTRFTMEAMKPAAREFSAHAKTFGSGIGTAIKSPFELARQNKEAETIRRLQQTLNNQANRQLKEGNIDRSRQLSQISAQHGEDQAQRFSKFGNDLKQGIRNTVAGGVGLGLQLVGAKGLTLPSAAKYAGVSGLIGGGMSKLTGGKFSEGFGEGAGNFLTYRGVNKLTQPTVDKITGKQLRVPLKKKIAVAAAANAGANVLEDEILTRIKTQKAPTNAERLTSAAIGAGIGAAGPTGSAIKDKFKQITGQYAPSRLNRKIPLKKAQSSQVSLETLMKQPRSARGEYAGWSEAQMMAIRQHPDFKKADLSPKLRKAFNDFDSKHQNPRGKWIKKPDGNGYMREQLQPAYGIVAGLEPEFDEEGKYKGVKVDPAKAAAGIAMMGGLKAVKNGDFKFDGKYSRGDIKTLQNQLDELLDTKSFNVSGKWQAELPARESAKRQIEHYASLGDQEAKKLLDRVGFLEDQINLAQNARVNPSASSKKQAVALKIKGSDSLKSVKNADQLLKENAPSGFVPVSKVIEQKAKVPLKKQQVDMSDPKNQQLDHLMNDGTRLLGMGYSRAQVDKIGAAEARKIIEQNIQPFDHPTYTGKPPINDEFAPQIGNKPKRIAGNKYSQFEPTKEEADFTKAQSYYNEIQQPGIKRWFNSVFNPLKNAPPEVQNIMQDWRNQNLVSRTKANEIAQQFTDIPEQDGWKIIQYIQNPTNRSAFDLGLDVKAYKPQIERLRGFYDQTRQEGLSQGLEINYLDNYLNQIWKESPEQIQAKIKAGAGSRPGFTKERFIPTYQEGVEIGLTPRFTHPAQLAAHYRLQLDKALSNKLMTDRLIESELLLPASSAPIDWKSIESPFFPKVKVDNGGSEPIVMDYKAPPDIANAINNIFDFKEPGLMSKVGSFASNLQNITLSGGIPFTPINSFTMANLQKDMLSGRVRGPLTATALSFSQKATKNYFTNNSQILSDMASEGIRINSNADYSKLYKNLVDNDGLWGKAKELFHSAFDKPTFERFMPMLQVEFYKDVYSGALKNGLDSTSAKKVAANATKNFYGLTDAFSRSIETEDAMRAVLLAPQFREAMIGFWGNTLKSVNPRTWRDPAFAQNRKFIVGSAIVFGLYNLANFANTGRWMHENKDGKELSLEIPLGGGRSFFSPFQFTISTVPRRFIEAGGYLAGGDIAGAAERLSTFASMPIQVATPLLTNRTFYDTPIYDAEDDSALGKIGKLAGYATEQVLPGPLGGMLAVAQGRKSIKEALPTIVEAPLYPSASSDVAHLKGKQVDQFKDLYEQNPDTAYQFSEAKKQSQALSDQKKTLEKQYKPQEKNWLEKLFSGNEVQASSSAENALLTDENLMYWDEEAEAVKTINYGKYTQAAPTDPIKKIRFENDKFDVAMSVFRAESNSLTDTQKEEVYKKLGVSGEDLEYYDLAAGSDYESSQIKREVVSQYLANIGPKDDKIEALKSLRRKVRGSRILSDNHIEELVDQGYLTGAEGKYLESIDWDEKTKSYTKTKKSGKKVSIKATPLQRRQIAASAGKVPLIKFGGGQRAGISIQLPQRQSQRQPRKIQLKRMALPQVNIKPTYFQGLSV